MGKVGENGKSLYGMTKGALVSGTRSLACELAKKRSVLTRFLLELLLLLLIIIYLILLIPKEELF